VLVFKFGVPIFGDLMSARHATWLIRGPLFTFINFCVQSLEFTSCGHLTFAVAIFTWLDDRLALQELLDDVGTKYVPPHVNIFYCFGGLVLTAFLVQGATGFALTFYYRPSVSDALASVHSIMSVVRSGWLVRSGHRWGASFMVT
jgi:hypothetical protein